MKYDITIEADDGLKVAEFVVSKEATDAVIVLLRYWVSIGGGKEVAQ